MTLRSIEDFEQIDKQVIIKFLEYCGRFLRKYPESSQQFKYIIEMITKKVHNTQSADGINRQIESCVQHCLQDKQKFLSLEAPKTEIEEYLSYLLFEIEDQRVDKTLNELLRLPWASEEKGITSVIFDMVLEIRQDQIRPLSQLLDKLKAYYPRVVVGIRDLAVEVVMNGVSEGYMFSIKQEIVTYTIFVTHMYNEGLLTSQELLKILFYLIHYDTKDRRFVVLDKDDTNQNFRMTVVIQVLTHVNEKLFKDITHKVFLALFQLYVLSRTYISAEQEYKVLDCLKRLYPALQVWKRADVDRLTEVAIILQERNPDILKKHMSSLEDPNYGSQRGQGKRKNGKTVNGKSGKSGRVKDSSIPDGKKNGQHRIRSTTDTEKSTPEEETDPSQAITKKVGEIQEMLRLEKTKKLHSNFDYEFNQMLSVSSI